MRVYVRGRFLYAAGVCLALSCSSGDSGPPGEDAAVQGQASSPLEPAADEGPFARAKFRKALGCDDCEVLNVAKLHLPETKIVAASAKLRTKDGAFPIVTLGAAGEVLDETRLLDVERTQVKAKYGKLRPELHAWLSSAADDDRTWIWIWADVKEHAARREDVTKDAAAAATHADRVKKDVEAGTKPIRAWLERNAPDAEQGDSGGPMIRAKVSARELRELEKLPQVAQLGTDRYPGKAESAPWSSWSQWGLTLRLAQAHALSTGSGAKICVKEETRPDVVSQLLIAGTASPSGITSSHTRATAGILRNLEATSPPYRSVAPDASIYIANWNGFVGTGGVNEWCRSTVAAKTLSYSHSVAGTSPGGLTGTDMSHDWLAKNSPYTLVVASAGSADYWGDTVANRGFNGLVVGGVFDGNTADRSDDTADTDVSWRNPTTAHGDHELPHVVAPTSAAAAGAEISGSSAATAMVAGVAALVEQAAPSLSAWPEGRKAIILATATGRADQGLFTSFGSGDMRIGAGEVDAYQAAQLAQSTWAAAYSGGTIAANGYLARTVTFSSDFGSDQYLTAKWKAKPQQSGRLRVAIAWDATTNCGTAGTGCTTDTQDADLDLHLFKKTDGTWTTIGTASCYSSSWDSTWEMCDIPVIANEEYLIAVKRYGTAASGTYLGVAWYSYQQPSGAACSTGTECASGTCSGGRCTCASDADCPDRFCNTSGQCTSKQPSGVACGRGAECMSGNCVDGVCCVEACGGTCRACSHMKKGYGADGVCEPIDDGWDPDLECTQQACAAGVVSHAWVCNGSGACRDGGTTSCAPYLCGADGRNCASSCAGDSSCVAGTWCSAGSCVPKQANGAACATGNACASGNCADGVCCNSACSDACSACNLTGAVGTCSPITTGACPPAWSTSASLQASQLTPTSARLAWSAATHAAVAGYRVYRDDVFQVEVGGTTTTWDATGLTTGTTYRFRVEAFATGSAETTGGPQVTFVPAPVLAAPPPPASTSVTTGLYDSMGFLFSGADPLQEIPEPQKIKPELAAVVRGVVRNANGDPIAGAKVSIVDHSEFGHTFTRLDPDPTNSGVYDLVVNGIGRVVVRIEYPEHLPVQRAVFVDPQRFVRVPDVVLTKKDRAVPVTLGSSSWQIAESSVVSDGDGARHATVLFAPGTVAKKVVGGVSTTLPANLSFRTTEFTANGIAAMPGELPATTAYTYAAGLTFDEAEGAERVDFVDAADNPKAAIVYVQAPVSAFPAGSPAPVGYYDPKTGHWVAEDSGLVVRLVDTTGGVARLDITGDDVPDAEAALTAQGITTAELAMLAGRYPNGTKLWRVALTHFTDWDVNWGVVPPDDSEPPEPTPPSPDEPDPCTRNGSIIHCENQVLGEKIPVAGTGLDLVHWSDRMPGYRRAYQPEVRISGSTLPESLLRIVVEWHVGGRVYSQVFDKAPNLTAKLDLWDGTDVYGRKMYGRQAVRVRVGYVYPAVYGSTSRFGYTAGARITGVRSGGSSGAAIAATGLLAKPLGEYSDTLTIWSTLDLGIGVLPQDGLGLGGWDFAQHHAYDVTTRALLMGTGERRKLDNANVLQMTAVAGQGSSRANDTLASNFLLLAGGAGATHVAVASDGTIYFIEGQLRIWRIDGATSKVNLVTTPDAAAYLTSMAIDANDRVFVVSANAVWRVEGSSFVRVAGSASGAAGSAGDGGPAVDALLSSPQAIAFGPDGSLYVAELPGWGEGRIRRIATDGKISTFAGGNGCPADDPLRSGPTCNFPQGASDDTYDGRPATNYQFPAKALTVARDGTLYAAMMMSSGATYGIWRIDTAGRMYRVAGDGNVAVTGDGGRAIDARTNPEHLAVGADGTLFIREASSRLRIIGRDGMIRTLALTGWGSAANRPGSAWDGYMFGPRFAIERTGTLVCADDGRIWRIAPVVAANDTTDIVVPSADGRELYVFDAAGRHKFTRDAFTGKNRWTFGYDAEDRLAWVTDLDGRTTTLVRGTGTADVVAPFGHTTHLTFNGDGRLATITNPEDAAHSRTSYTLEYESGPLVGLLKTLVDANGTHSFEWYSDGALKKDSNPAGGSIAPARAPVADGWKATLTEAVDSTHELATEYTVTDPTAGADKGKHLRSVKAPDGTVALRSTEASGDTTYTAPGDASTLTTSLTSSPLFGRLAPVKNTTYSSGGMTLQTTVSRTVMPTGATYATLTSQTDTVTTSGTGGAVTTASSSVTRTLTRTLVAGSFTGGSLVTTTGLGRQRKLTFDANGRVTRLEFPGVDPAIAPVDLEWTNGFLTKVTQGGRVIERTYDTGSGGSGWLSSVLDPIGRTHSFDTYDLVGRVKTQTLPGALTLQTSYDAAGNLESVTPPGRSAHGFLYTARNQLDTYTAPDVTVTPPAAPVNRVTDYDYDLTGFLTKVTPPTTGAKIEFFRDLTGSSVPKGKLHRVVDSHGATTTYAYNPATGKITGITSESTSTPATAGVSLAFGYDGALPTSTTWLKSGWPASLVLERTFDNHFRVASQKVQAGTVSEVALRYDADGLLVKTGLPATVDSSPTMTLSRNSSPTGVPNNGFLTGVTVGSIVDARTYNTFGEPKTYAASLGGTSLLTFDYEPTGSPRDGLGRIVKKTETVLGGPAKTVGYLYDTAGRLWKVTDAAGNVVVKYDYGANGTRTSKTTYSTPGDFGTGTTIDAEYDEQDRIKSYGDFTYGFRDSGELAWKRDGSGAETAYTYDNRGNLLKVVLPGGTTIEYEVDPLGRRVGRKLGTDHVRWIYDGQLRIVGEVDGAGNLTQFVYATRPNVPEYMVRGGVVYRILTDHLGSVRLVVRASDGEVMQRMEYDEFGAVESDWIAVGWSPVPFGFAGGLYDRDTELVRLGARDYDALTGRWTAKDPIRFAGGLNLYGYVASDPINYYDPHGEMKLPASPAGLPVDWQQDPGHRYPHGTRYKHPSGMKLDWHPAKPGEPGWEGRDHWHVNPQIKKKRDRNAAGLKDHYSPGEEIADPMPMCSVEGEPDGEGSANDWVDGFAPNPGFPGHFDEDGAFTWFPILPLDWPGLPPLPNFGPSPVPLLAP